MAKVTLCDICDVRFDPTDPVRLNRPAGDYDIEIYKNDNSIAGKKDTQICPRCKLKILAFISELHQESPYVMYNEGETVTKDKLLVWHKGYTTEEEF